MGMLTSTVLEPEIAPHSLPVEVLLVDEDVSYLGKLASILQQEGFAVVNCSSYGDAVPVLALGGFDVVILDQGGACFEGKRVLEQARQVDPRACVLVIARAADLGVYLESMQLGAADYLEKPLDPAELIPVIIGHLLPGGIRPWTSLAARDVSTPAERAR